MRLQLLLDHQAVVDTLLCILLPLRPQVIDPSKGKHSGEAEARDPFSAEIMEAVKTVVSLYPEVDEEEPEASFVE